VNHKVNAPEELQKYDDDELIQELSERMELQDEEAAKFHAACMERLGYKPVQNFVVPDTDDTGSGHQSVRNARARQRARNNDGKSSEQLFGIRLGGTPYRR